jgi:hypothetical protein
MEGGQGGRFGLGLVGEEAAMLEIDEAVTVLEETLQVDLERCARAIREHQPDKAAEHLEVAMAKLSGLTDVLRNASVGERD